VELRHQARAGLRAALAVLALALAAPAGASASQLVQPRSPDRPPRFFRLSAATAIRVADRAWKVRAERRKHPGIRPTAYENGIGRWQVSYFLRGKELVQVQVDDRSGTVLEQWRGPQVAWIMARGYPGAFGRKLNAPYVWIPLCVLFVLPFVDPRRPFRLLHLDLLVLLAFGASHVFFNRGEIGISVPLVYPVLGYLLVRALLAGFRPRAPGRGPLVPLVPAAWLLVAAVFLVGFRIGLNVLDSNVIDVGYSGVIGADRITHDRQLYGPRFAGDNEHGDTYGPVNYLLYVPFEQALPWSGRWDDLPAAHGAAIAFDLLTMVGLYLLGRRIRAGPEGRALGAAAVYAWVSYPYTAFALETNSNDAVVSAFVVAALLAVTVRRRRPALSALGGGLAVGLGAAAKFAPLALAPLLATAGERPRLRFTALFALAVVAAVVLTFLPFVPHGGLRELYDRTLGYQLGRPSPFSVFGQAPSLGWLHTAVKAGAVGLALLVAAVPRRKDFRQVAALAAAVLIAVELTATHWFYLYIVWFTPPLLVAVLAAYRQPIAEPGPLERPPRWAALSRPGSGVAR
jgi:hypothetical protein